MKNTQIADLIGLLVGSAVLLLTINLVSILRIDIWWQIIAVMALASVNLVVWGRNDIPSMSFLDAARIALFSVGTILLIAIVDTGIGYMGGEHDVANAFLHSGAAGGILDCILIGAALLVGLPTLVRSIILFHR
ncbi:MAG: hypothetical protein ACXWIN_08815 [Burkholderiaceae bacterium]